MKTTLIALTMLAISSTAQSSELCMGINALAESAMKSRQAGVSAAKMMSIEYHESIRDIAHLMIEGAYKMPRYRTDDSQQRAITEFANVWFILCLNTMDEED